MTLHDRGLNLCVGMYYHLVVKWLRIETSIVVTW